MALIAPLLFAPSARADGWVPCDASGTPLAYGDQGYDDSTGGAVLIDTGDAPTVTPSGTYSLLSDWWLAAYSPNPVSEGDGYPNVFYGLSINSSAANCVTSANDYVVGYYNPVDYWNTAGAGPMPTSPNIGGEVDASQSGNLVAHFLWTGPGPAENPAHFLVQENVSAGAAVDFENSGAAGGLYATASTSLGSLSALTAASFKAGNPDPVNNTAKILITVSPAGNIATISRSASVNTTTSNSINYGVWVGQPDSGWYYVINAGPNWPLGNGPTLATANASASGAAVHDNRAVAISSNIETSYRKGTNQQGATVPVPNVRNADGSISVDSVVSWQDAAPGVEQGWAVNNLPLTATAANFNSPVYSWSLQGQGELSYPFSTFNPIDYTLADPTQGDFPLSTTVTVNATDSDGAVATNFYNITWHLPTDQWALASAGASTWQLADLKPPVSYCGYNGDISGDWDYTKDTNGAGTALSGMFAAGAGLADPPWAAFLIAASIYYADTEPAPAVHSVNFDDAWADPSSSFDPTPADNTPATMQLYQMSPKLRLEYQPQHYTGDMYDMHGYAGPTTEDFDRVIRTDYCGDFTLVGSN